MQNPFFQVRIPDDVTIQNYWNWLLGADPDGNPIPNGNVFYMHASYDYVDDLQEPRSQHPQRINLSGDIPSTAGSESQPVNIPKNVSIFHPLLDTVVTDHDVNSNGVPLTVAEMKDILDDENGQVRVRHLNATINNLTKNTGPQAIHGNLLGFRTTAPSSSNSATFDLTVHPNSPFADKLEFAFPRGITVQARAEGFYVELYDITPGDTYHISSRCHGVRGYKAYMDYYIHVL
jgi:hypothetical protein